MEQIYSKEKSLTGLEIVNFYGFSGPGKMIFSETVYGAGDKFYISGGIVLLSKTFENKLFMVDLGTGYAIPVVNGITEEHGVKESELRKMFSNCDTFRYLDPALSLTAVGQF